MKQTKKNHLNQKSAPVRNGGYTAADGVKEATHQAEPKLKSVLFKEIEKVIFKF